ncbi:MAG: CoA pyrophosphatase [Halioglobus sp.]|nr:CoA pyrophosphatase [Halioglobus sp.]
MQPLTNHRYNNTTLQQIRDNIGEFSTASQPLGDLRAAAVALVVVERNGEPALLLTRRAGSLRAHSGQWALPGGRMDAGETAEQGALRELREEVNLDLPRRAVVGLLDDYVTRSGYRMTPVVVWAGRETGELHPNPDEVASIHTASFRDLVRPEAPHFERIPESDREVLSMKLEADQIYAPTAALLYQFREVAILGRPTRVLEYDQPMFAWR